MMKKLLFPMAVAVGLLAFAPRIHAADAKVQLQELVEKVKAKLQKGDKSEAALTEELKAFDALLAEHKDEKTDDVAQIPFMKAMLYVQIFEDDEKAGEILKKIQTDFPETKPGKQAGSALASIASQSESKKIQKGLVEGAQFPNFEEKDLDGKPLSVEGMKGKVVLIDFWATWCGPCVAELPNVQKAYEKYHSKGFEIIGISLDQDKEKLTSFIKEKNMPWPQYFDGKGWQSKIGQQYGINSIPATYLLDQQGKIIGKSLRGEALDAALAKTLK